MKGVARWRYVRREVRARSRILRSVVIVGQLVKVIFVGGLVEGGALCEEGGRGWWWSYRWKRVA